MKWLAFAAIAASSVVCLAGDQIVIRNGVQCHRRLIPIHGTHEYRVQYDPVVVTEKQVDVHEEYKAPYAPPSEQDLLELSDAEYERELLKIIAKAAKDQSRRADFKLLRTLGLQIGEPDTGIYSKSVYSHGYERPNESQFGISVIRSADFVGTDPTDVIAAQIGRNVDGVRELFGDLNTAQSEALRDLIQSRAVNTERIARALEETAKSQADTAKIRALADSTKRSHIESETNISGSFLQQQLNQIIQQNVPSGTASGVQSIISSKCGKCHDPSSEQFKADRMDLSDYDSLSFDSVSSVIQKIRAGSMPPQGEPELTPDEEKALTDDFVQRATGK